MSKHIAFVTGATGFLGSHIAKQLVEDEGMHVRMLARKGSRLDAVEGLDVEVVEGDLNSPKALATGMKNAKWVFHVAASVAMWKPQWAESLRINGEGTRNMVDAALAAGVKKFVHTSSGSTLGDAKPDGTVDEECFYDMEDKGLVYPHNKWLAEQEIHDGVRRGLDAVITMPAMIFGPGDLNVNIGRYLIEVKKGRGLMATEGWNTVCDVRDVARGHILAAQKGRTGESYILAGESLSNFDLFKTIAEEVGGQPPIAKIPTGLLRGLGRVLDAVANFTGEAPFLSSDMTQEAGAVGRSSSAKAERELGFYNRPFRESLADTHAWYKEKGIM